MSIKRPESLPSDLVPGVNELPGDLAEVATIIERHAPGRGVAITLELAERFRSTYVYFHNTDAIWRAARNRRIVELYTSGTKVPAIAREVNLGEKYVWSLLGKEPEDNRQLKMF